ncbi:hypothetical protein J6590_092169 [Homalodisca vitripennis]|nr:hypothetical protein J6590_092169 [Homalodisca vitripennis]
MESQWKQMSLESTAQLEVSASRTTKKDTRKHQKTQMTPEAQKTPEDSEDSRRLRRHQKTQKTPGDSEDTRRLGRHQRGGR